MDKLVGAIFAAIFMFMMVMFFAFLFAIITQWAWEGSIAQIFHLPNLTFWQAFWLNTLGGMLCKSSSVSSS
jgi:hypothetical protein